MKHAAPEPDEVVLGDRYALGAELGAGSSAVVYRAQDLRTGRAVAVKVFAPAGSTRAQRRRRREIEALGRLAHPGLVQVLDGDLDAPAPYLVTDLVDGPSLAEALLDGALHPDEVVRIGAELAAALAVVHAAGLVHRDVKPANVLMDGGTRPRLTDFGIALVLDGTASTTGTAPGTAAYMAPEQVTGDPASPAVDVYALALVLIESASGHREYPGAALESAIARLTRPPVVPEGLPPAVGELLELMTAADPEDRPTAQECAALLVAAAGPQEVGAVEAWRRHWRPVTALVLAAAVALTVTGLLPREPADAQPGSDAGQAQPEPGPVPGLPVLDGPLQGGVGAPGQVANVRDVPAADVAPAPQGAGGGPETSSSTGAPGAAPPGAGSGDPAGPSSSGSGSRAPTGGGGGGDVERDRADEDGDTEDAGDEGSGEDGPSTPPVVQLPDEDGGLTVDPPPVDAPILPEVDLPAVGIGRGSDPPGQAKRDPGKSTPPGQAKDGKDR